MYIWDKSLKALWRVPRWTRKVTVQLTYLRPFFVVSAWINGSSIENWFKGCAVSVFTGFYGNADPNNRKSSWDMLGRVGSSAKEKWIIGGHFNAILDNSEKEGGRRKQHALMDDFREKMDSEDIMDKIEKVGHDLGAWQFRRYKRMREMNDGLTMALTGHEIIKAFKQMDPRKAPGIDELSRNFYKENWEVVGDDILNYVMMSLRGDTSVEFLNETIIVLIPKIKEPIEMTHSQPFTLCRVIYKIVAKFL
ncbi:hypothetical protein GOBAR_AA16865 [Gossypium barbadense]|uniref:Reverse transcriptase domain-containing protein n=1 Tax=Gossypium barbadense TaxID=3634 RepID=A0A2P5XKD8_GOSBA|nr:hypothetical protein GOBAR_AA16865 [Gossypium barbadense]